MTRPLIGSLCSGYEGLGMAVQAVLGGTAAWHCENDADASKVLAHHWPTVPNVGDLTTVDWANVEPVDIVTAGFPCQDLSYAGCGAGITEGTRSGLWYAVADALGVLRPRLVVLENVAAIVGRRPGLDVVLASLASLGFDASWTCVRASDVGAPHRRDRWFCVATDTGRLRGIAGGVAAPGQAEGGGPLAVPGMRSGAWPSADPTSNGWDEGRPEPAGIVRGPDAALSGTASHTTLGGVSDRPNGRDPAGQHVGTVAGAVHRDRTGGAAEGVQLLERATPVVAWGPYTPAIRRWERTLGRPAPAPTEPGRNGQPRLSPAFVEWLMGLPTGHVTAVPGVARNAQLRILGNGVVPQQAELALRMILGRTLAGAA